jgi:hypothetical protein
VSSTWAGKLPAPPARGQQAGSFCASTYTVSLAAKDAGGGIIRQMMKFTKSTIVILALLLAGGAFAQDKASGGIKGKVRVETGSPSGVTVIVRQGDREVAQGLTDKNGEFVVSRLAPGRYGVTFRKPGLSVGTIEDVDVKAGKPRSLGDHLILTIDEGSIAFIRGSVFTPDDRSARGVRIELARIEADGTVKKIDGRVTNEIGAFVFRLKPDPAKYRVTAKPNGGESVSKDVEIDGAAIYRVSLSLKKQ